MNIRKFLLGALPALLSQMPLSAGEPVDFVRDVKPILEMSCVSCHREDNAKGKLRLDNAKDAFKSDEVIVKGKPEDSASTSFLNSRRTTTTSSCLQDSEKSYTLPAWELAILKQWIQEGAKWPESETLKPTKRLPKKVEFVEHVQPILEFNCVRCHREENDKGDLQPSTMLATLSGSMNASHPANHWKVPLLALYPPPR